MNAAAEKTIIVESGKCAWGKCIFCSFGKRGAGAADAELLKEKIDRALRNARGIHTLKFFNSGSFLDRRQIPEEAQDYLLGKCSESGIKELVVECRTEFVTEKNLEALKQIIPASWKAFERLTTFKKAGSLKIIFALGLEAADNALLKKICKGMTLQDYERAAALLKKSGFGVRTYLMANLPFVADAKKSLDASVKYALKHSDSVAIINTFAYGYSPLFEMWLRDEWHPLDKKEFDALVKKYRTNKKINIYFGDYVSYPRFPESMQKKLDGVGREYLLHPYFNVWQEYLARFYEIPEGKKYALFLPCSFRKPYSQSKTHREILRRLTGLRQYPLIHQVMISSPGIIPREFEAKYPFAHYDWNERLETQEIKKQYIEVTQKRIEEYLKSHGYKKIFAYLKPSSESFIALCGACRALGLRLISCADERLFEALGKPHDAILNEGTNPLVNRKMLDKMIEALRREL